MTIRDQIYAIVSSTLDARRDDIHPAARWKDYAADSMAIIETMFAVQERFDVLLVDDVEEIATVDDLVHVVERKLASRASADSGG